MSGLVAGHTFDSLGRCTRKMADGGDCPIRWRSIASVDETDIQGKDIAHYGLLSSDELGQIRRMRQSELEAIDKAMASVSGRS